MAIVKFIYREECAKEGACLNRLEPKGCVDCPSYEPVKITVGCIDKIEGTFYCEQCKSQNWEFYGPPCEWPHRF
jgi:hypothetical protein